jgi:hypothetical protein
MVVSKLMKLMVNGRRKASCGGSWGNRPKYMENKKMNRSELLETAASTIAGITTGLAFVVLYVMLTAPVSETVQRLIS